MKIKCFQYIWNFQEHCQWNCSLFCQSFKQIIPSVFLYGKLKIIFRGFYQRIVKPEVMEANATVVNMMSLYLAKENNLLQPASVNVGFGAQSLVKKLPTVNQKVVHEFRMAARNERVHWKALSTFSTKVQVNQSHLFFSWILIGTVDSTIMENRFGTLLEILRESGWVSTVTAEKTTKEYKMLPH